jgi:Flp pilus assembly protein TadG
MRTPQRPAAGKRRCRRGAAAVELALVLPLLAALALGCVDLGRFVYTYIAVTNAARAGAGFGSTHSYTASTYTTWQAKAQQAAADDMGSVSGFDKSQVTVASVPDDSSNPGGPWRAQVTVPCSFRTLVTWPLLPNSFTVQRTVAMRGVQ